MMIVRVIKIIHHIKSQAGEVKTILIIDYSYSNPYLIW